MLASLLASWRQRRRRRRIRKGNAKPKSFPTLLRTIRWTTELEVSWSKRTGVIALTRVPLSLHEDAQEIPTHLHARKIGTLVLF